MDKDLKQFENRSDDWLAKERQEENKVSAWDFDEGKKIKEYHEKNCEAREIKERHEQIHSGNIKPVIRRKSFPVLPIILVLVGMEIITAVSGELGSEVTPLNVIVVFVVLFTIINLIKKGQK